MAGLVLLWVLLFFAISSLVTNYQKQSIALGSLHQTMIFTGNHGSGQLDTEGAKRA
jgi:hypothetical protein